MENLVSLVLEKGITFAIAVVAVALVAYFIKRENDRRDQKFDEFEAAMNVWRDELSGASLTTKSMATKSIETLKLESNMIRNKMEALTESLLEMKVQITKEMLGLKIHSNQIHERSENIKKSIDGVTGDVKVIKSRQEQYEDIFKKIIEKSKRSKN